MYLTSSSCDWSQSLGAPQESLHVENLVFGPSLDLERNMEVRR